MLLKDEVSMVRITRWKSPARTSFRQLAGPCLRKSQDAIRAQITDTVVKRIAGRKLIGSIDQYSDSTDILSEPSWRPTLRLLYE